MVEVQVKGGGGKRDEKKGIRWRMKRKKGAEGEKGRRRKRKINMKRG